MKIATWNVNSLNIRMPQLAPWVAEAQPDVLEIVCTNSVPIPKTKLVPKLRVLSIAPAMAEAMRRIHNGESVSSLFH